MEYKIDYNTMELFHHIIQPTSSIHHKNPFFIIFNRKPHFFGYTLLKNNLIMSR